MIRYVAAGVGAVLVASALFAQSPQAIHAMPVSKPAVSEAYGAAPQELGELRLPAGQGPFPVIVVIHGGCWMKGFDTLAGTAPIADALTKRGFATWNIEYRQLGEAGAGWPGTFQDWGAGVDHLRALAKRYPLDLKRVGVIGHSAGAYAAAFVASRPRLPKTDMARGAKPLPVRLAVAIDGPAELAPFVGMDKAVCGAPVIEQLVGGTPETQPARFAQISPLAHAPLGVPVALVSSQLIGPEAAEQYRAAAAAKGQDVRVLRVADGTHFNVISPGFPQWQATEDMIVAAMPK